MHTTSNRRQASLTLAMAVAAVAWSPLAQAAQPATLKIEHAKGVTEEPLKPQRVVVYDLAALDVMQALNLPVVGVPKAQFPHYLAAYADARYQVAGSMFEPDYEVLSQLQPDLIVVAGRSSAKYETLSKIAPTLDLSGGKLPLLDGMQRNVMALASLWGQQARGQQLMQQVRAEVDALKSVAAKAGPGLLVLAVNRNMSGQAPGSRFGLIHDVMGVQPAVPADSAKPRGLPLKMEDIARINPQWLYVIDRNAGTGTTQDKDGQPVLPSKELFDNEIIRNTDAGKKQQVVFVDPKNWYLLGSAGPTAMRENVAQIRAALTRTVR